MNDCTNAKMRDQLPDLLHERLDASARAAVLAHVEGCEDCRDELRLLGEVRSVLEARTPRVDLNYVIEALPKPPAGRAVTIEPRRRVWSDWRVAAAVTLIVAGGSSVALLGREHASLSADTVQIAARTAVAAASPAVAPAPAESTPATTKAVAARAKPVATEVTAESSPDISPTAAEAASDASLSNLSPAQLKALLQDIDNLKAVPVAEPEPVSLRIGARTAGDIL